MKKVEEIKTLPDLEVDVKKVESWIYEAEDFSEKKDLEKGSDPCLSVLYFVFSIILISITVFF